MFYLSTDFIEQPSPFTYLLNSQFVIVCFFSFVLAKHLKVLYFSKTLFSVSILYHKRKFCRYFHS